MSDSSMAHWGRCNQRAGFSFARACVAGVVIHSILTMRHQGQRHADTRYHACEACAVHELILLRKYGVLRAQCLRRGSELGDGENSTTSFPEPERVDNRYR